MITAERSWSKQQIAIFDWFSRRNTHGKFPWDDDSTDTNLIARARAGTGKTTVVIEGVKRAPEKRILICAFSKIIQEELVTRLGKSHSHIEAKTLHSVGYACVRRFRNNIKPVFDNDRADVLATKVCGPQPPDAIKNLVSKLHTKGREIAPHAKVLGELTDIAITFECQPDEQWNRCLRCGQIRLMHVGADHLFNGFDLEYIEQKALEAMELASQVQSGDTIDGSDMIFLPVRNGWLAKQYDLVVVDEAQDMTTAQLEIAQGVLNEGGRIAVVGDDRQAIFGFRGADSGALDRLKVELDAVELGLTTTYRCGKAIVRLAQEYVPDFEAGPDNSEGEILNIHIDQLVHMAGPSDFILSRVNAPIVSIAMQLLKAGKRTRIAGQDIGAGLKALIRRLKAGSVSELLVKLEAWVSREHARLTKQMAGALTLPARVRTIQNKMEAVRDQADMIISLVEGAKNISEVENKINVLFTKDDTGFAGMITCSSVHRAKGLEADRVFILRDTLRSHTVEETNIAYVAITRAKHSLVWVNSN